MDEFNFFQFLNDNNEILQAEDQHARDFPTFSLHFGEYFDDFVPSQAQNPRDPSPPNQQQTKKIKSHYKSWMLQDFPLFQAMKYMSLSLSLPIKIRPAPQNNG